ncbi:MULTISPECIES: alpha/beta fold hydrolase [Tsukamurella]|uniref:Alpha/beta hydrolase n=1 Tax=Tsukamurella columbiensis TaxID=128509 RepID=A0ABX1LGQ4_9ACTN|nr:MULTISPECIES: alpha/beta hydrolase [Tsukamurella]NMD56183.1 alpha/beta hydrolase [Tsukamurella columbiensis]
MAAAHSLDLEELFVTVHAPDVCARVLTTASSGPPIVWINGIGSPAMGLSSLAARMPGARHVLVDLPGHSLAPPSRWNRPSLRALAVDIVTGVLDRLRLDRADVVGASLGGQFALWAAADAPDRIARVALLGAPGTAVAGVVPTAGFCATASDVRGRLAESLMRCPTPRAVARAALAEAVGGDTARALPADIVDLHRLPLRLPGRAASYRALLRRLIRGRSVRPENVIGPGELATIETPILFVWGRHDAFLAPDDLVRAAVSAMPRADIVATEGGHAPWFDDLEHCTDLVRPFLAGTGDPSTERNQRHV